MLIFANKELSSRKLEYMAVFNEIERYFERNADLHVMFIFDQMHSLETELSDKNVTPWEEHPEYVFEVFDGHWFTTKHKI